MSGNYPPGLTQRGFDEAHDNLGPDPDAIETEPCDHCHGEFDPVELKRIVSDFLCPDCWAEYVTDWIDAPDETLADMLSYRQRIL